MFLLLRLKIIYLFLILKLNNITNEIRKKYIELTNKIKNTNPENLDEKTKELYNNILDMNIELETKNLETCKNCLKKITAIKNQSSELTANIVKNILQNIDIKKFDEVNNNQK